MSYRFKGVKVVINGVEQIITPGTLPPTPANGHYAIDSSDGKLKVWNQSKNRWIILGDASDVVFNNATNGFVSTNVQSAIEESKTSSIAAGRFTIVTSFNGTVGNNQWMGYNELIPGNQVPIVLPVKCVLEDIVWTWSSTLINILGIIVITGSVDGRFDIYKNGTAAGNIVMQESFSGSNSKYRNNIGISFNPGNFFIGRWVDTGVNPSDMAVVYYFRTAL